MPVHVGHHLVHEGGGRQVGFGHQGAHVGTAQVVAHAALAQLGGGMAKQGEQLAGSGIIDIEAARAPLAVLLPYRAGVGLLGLTGEAQQQAGDAAVDLARTLVAELAAQQRGIARTLILCALALQPLGAAGQGVAETLAKDLKDTRHAVPAETAAEQALRVARRAVKADAAVQHRRVDGVLTALRRREHAARQVITAVVGKGGGIPLVVLLHPLHQALLTPVGIERDHRGTRLGWQTVKGNEGLLATAATPAADY